MGVQLALIVATCCNIALAAGFADPLLLQAELEDGFNRQILTEYEAFYAYENMAVYFSRPDVGLQGFANFFRKSADEEIGHARKFIEFVNKRNGRVILQHLMPSAESTPQVFKSVKEAMALAIRKELQVSKAISDLYARASSLNDGHAQDFLDDFLEEQVESTSKLRVIQARLDLCDSATFLIDQELR